jgi:Holliday junction resolvase
LLVVFGVALVVLAAHDADHEVVAPVFAFTGVACVVLGVILHRVEALELSATSLRAKLFGVVKREDLTLEEKADAMIDLLEQQRTSRSPENRPRTGGAARTTAFDFERAVAEFFREDGWEVEDVGGGAPDVPVDLLARSGDDLYVIEAKTFQHPSVADIARAVDQVKLAQKAFPGAKLVIAVPTGTKVTPGAQEVLRATGVSLYEVPFRVDTDGDP